MSNLEQNSDLRIIQNLVQLDKILPCQDELVFEFVKNKTVNLGNSKAYHFEFFKAFDIKLNKEITRVKYSSSYRPSDKSRIFIKPKIKYYFGSVDNFEKIENDKVFESLEDLYRSI